MTKCRGHSQTSGFCVRTKQAGTTRVDTTASVPVPERFMPHPNFSDEVNRNITASFQDLLRRMNFPP